MMEPNDRAGRSRRRRAPDANELLVPLDPASRLPLYRQVYEAIRDAILTGRLTPGQRIPSSRVMAAELGVARNTVTQALDQLRTEGYLTSNRGGGTRVRPVIPDMVLSVPRTPTARRTVARPARMDRPAERAAGAATIEVRLSARGAALARAGATLSRRGGTPPVPFRLGVPPADAFPIGIWRRIAAQHWRAGRVPLGETDPRGERALREAIVEHASSARGVRCTPDQVLVTTGTQQALDLAARLLLEPGDEAWVEDPGYPGTFAALAAAGARLVPVPVDAEGIDVAEGERRAPRARLACVTPSHQYPLGPILSAPRRTALLAWARRAEAWIFEDDYDSEFRYAGRPLPSLQGLDAEHRDAGAPTRVLYAGSFNKTLVPGIRLGYLILPEALVEPFRAARAAIDRQASSFEQAILADFIGEGHYARHVRRLRALCLERQTALLDAARRGLGEWLALEPDPAGLHLVGRLRGGWTDGAAATAGRQAGLELYPLSHYYLSPPPAGTGEGLLLGYAPFDGDAIRDGVRRLARVLAAGPPGS